VSVDFAFPVREDRFDSRSARYVELERARKSPTLSASRQRGVPDRVTFGGKKARVRDQMRGWRRK
jgi:hypothetical protein